MKVKLTEEEISFLKGFTSTGKRTVRQQKRANIFLSLHEGITYLQAAQKAGGRKATVNKLVRRYREVKNNLLLALEEAPRPERGRKVTAIEEAHIIALACSAPPAGYGRWTLRLLRDKAVELGHLPAGISHETVRTSLKKANLSL